MAYSAKRLKIGMSYIEPAGEWSWDVLARGDASGEFASDCGTNTDVEVAMDDCKAAILARLA